MITNNINENQLNKYTLFFDGCSKGNPGLSGAGFVIYNNNENELSSNSFFVGDNQTNNYAEYMGLIQGMEEAIRINIKNLVVSGDSLLVINQMNGKYKVKSSNLLLLYQKAKQLEKRFESISYNHIYRKYNKKADELANNGIIIKS
jgi:ribonuclease HI